MGWNIIEEAGKALEGARRLITTGQTEEKPIHLNTSTLSQAVSPQASSETRQEAQKAQAHTPPPAQASPNHAPAQHEKPVTSHAEAKADEPAPKPIATNRPASTPTNSNSTPAVAESGSAILAVARGVQVGKETVGSIEARTPHNHPKPEDSSKPINEVAGDSILETARGLISTSMGTETLAKIDAHVKEHEEQIKKQETQMAQISISDLTSPDPIRRARALKAFSDTIVSDASKSNNYGKTQAIIDIINHPGDPRYEVSIGNLDANSKKLLTGYLVAALQQDIKADTTLDQGRNPNEPTPYVPQQYSPADSSVPQQYKSSSTGQIAQELLNLLHSNAGTPQETQTLELAMKRFREAKNSQLDSGDGHTALYLDPQSNKVDASLIEALSLSSERTIGIGSTRTREYFTGIRHDVIVQGNKTEQNDIQLGPELTYAGATQARYEKVALGDTTGEARAFLAAATGMAYEINGRDGIGHSNTENAARLAGATVGFIARAIPGVNMLMENEAQQKGFVPVEEQEGRDTIASVTTAVNFIPGVGEIVPFAANRIAAVAGRGAELIPFGAFRGTQRAMSETFAHFTPSESDLFQKTLTGVNEVLFKKGGASVAEQKALLEGMTQVVSNPKLLKEMEVHQLGRMKISIRKMLQHPENFDEAELQTLNALKEELNVRVTASKTAANRENLERTYRNSGEQPSQPPTETTQPNPNRPLSDAEKLEANYNLPPIQRFDIDSSINKLQQYYEISANGQFDRLNRYELKEVGDELIKVINSQEAMSKLSSEQLTNVKKLAEELIKNDNYSSVNRNSLLKFLETTSTPAPTSIQAPVNQPSGADLGQPELKTKRENLDSNWNQTAQRPELEPSQPSGGTNRENDIRDEIIDRDFIFSKDYDTLGQVERVYNEIYFGHKLSSQEFIELQNNLIKISRSPVSINHLKTFLLDDLLNVQSLAEKVLKDQNTNLSNEARDALTSLLNIQFQNL